MDARPYMTIIIPARTKKIILWLGLFGYTRHALIESTIKFMIWHTGNDIIIIFFVLVGVAV